MVKGQGQTAGFDTNDVHSIYIDPFALKSPNMVQYMPRESRWSILIFRSRGQRNIMQKKYINYILHHSQSVNNYKE